MKQKKRGLAIFLIVLGAFVTLMGALLVLITLSMILTGEDLISNGILAVILLALTFALGIIPLMKGIRILQGKEKLQKNEKTQSGQNIQSVQLSVPKESVISKEATAVERFITEQWSEQSSKQILCRDTQFDNGDGPMVKALLKIAMYVILPIVAMCLGYALVNQSAGGRIVPNTWQAWASMLMIVIGCFCMVMSMVVWGKYNAVGNKFYYYIIHEEYGVSVACLDTGKLGAYVVNKAGTLERIKATPSLLYVLLFFLCCKSRRVAVRLARMQMYFQVNQKHHFVEKLLQSAAYDQYSDKIIAVQKMKYFSKGCEVHYTVMVDGVQEERRQYIYRETAHYELLMDKFKQMYVNNYRVGYELSAVQATRVRKNIYRRLAILGGLAVVCVVLIYAGMEQYYEAAYKADVLSQSGAEVLSYAEGVLASRGRRRAYRVGYLLFFVMGVSLVKLLSDAIRVHTFTCMPVEVLSYHEKGGSWYKKLTGDYRYFATVRYNNATVNVGLSKEMWEKREHVTPLLVLRKNVPYCIIF